MHISEPLSSHKHTKLMKMKVNIVAAKYNVSNTLSIIKIGL